METNQGSQSEMFNEGMPCRRTMPEKKFFAKLSTVVSKGCGSRWIILENLSATINRAEHPCDSGNPETKSIVKSRHGMGIIAMG